MFQTLRFALHTFALARVPQRDPARIAGVQQRRLRRLVKYAVARSPFYRKHYAWAMGDDGFQLADLPPVTKTELMAEFDEVVTDREIRLDDVRSFAADPRNLGKYFREQYVVSHTSGTQGRPMLIVQHRDQVELLFALQFARGYAGPKVNAGEAVHRLFHPVRLAVVTMRPGFYPSASAFTYLPAAARAFVDLLHLGFDDPKLIEKLRHFRPNALTAYASVLTSLSTHAQELNLAPDLGQITNISEALCDSARQCVQQAFGTPILDAYAMGECPFLSNGCPATSGAHINADWAILEVVDEQYRPVPSGATGKKVLVTNLANTVQPIIRYEIGDLVEMTDEPCPCGSRLPHLSHIGGRAAEALWISDGSGTRRVLLNVFKCACEYLHEVREWQVRQSEPNRIKVCLELLPGRHLPRERAERTLNERLRFFGLPRETRVDVAYVNRLLPDAKSGKFRHLVGIKNPRTKPRGVVDAP